MKHRLSRPGAVIDDRSITLGLQAPLARKLGGHQSQVPEQRLIFCYRLPQRSQMLARDHEQVDRSLRMNVFNRHHPLVFMNDSGWQLTVDDPAEEAVQE